MQEHRIDDGWQEPKPIINEKQVLEALNDPAVDEARVFRGTPKAMDQASQRARRDRARKRKLLRQQRRRCRR